MSEKPRLLLFDDASSTADIMMDYLEDNFDVTWVSNKAELEEKIDNDFAVILVDVSIVGSSQSGYEIIDELRQKYLVTTTPIVVYSAVRNVDEIRKKMGKIFYSYVKKIGKNWQKVLLQECTKACKENRRTISHDVLEAYFTRLGRMDSIIDSSEMPEGFVTMESGQGITIRSVLSILKNNEMDEQIWRLLENALWNKYRRLSEMSAVSRR